MESIIICLVDRRGIYINVKTIFYLIGVVS